MSQPKCKSKKLRNGIHVCLSSCWAYKFKNKKWFCLVKYKFLEKAEFGHIAMCVK